MEARRFRKAYIADRTEPVAWRVGDDKNRGECTNDSVWRYVRGGTGKASSELAAHWAVGSDLLQIGWNTTPSGCDAKGCALFDVGSFGHSTPVAVFWFPYLPAFGRQFRECANWQPQTRPKIIGAFESEHDRGHLYAYVVGIDRGAAIAIEREIFGDLCLVVSETGHK